MTPRATAPAAFAAYTSQGAAPPCDEAREAVNPCEAEVPAASDASKGGTVQRLIVTVRLKPVSRCGPVWVFVNAEGGREAPSARNSCAAHLSDPGHRLLSEQR